MNIFYENYALETFLRRQFSASQDFWSGFSELLDGKNEARDVLDQSSTRFHILHLCETSHITMFAKHKGQLAWHVGRISTPIWVNYESVEKIAFKMKKFIKISTFFIVCFQT